MLAERLILAAVLLTALLPQFFYLRRHRAPAWNLMALATVGTMVLALGFTLTPGRPPDHGEHRFEARVERVSEDGYVSSGTCRKCHPAEYATWHASYHHTMTQRATPKTVLGDFGDVKLDLRGRTYHLERRGEEFWVSWSTRPIEDIRKCEMVILSIQRLLDTKDSGLTPGARADAERQMLEQGENLVQLRRQMIRIERPVLQTTGSHHQQVYWVQENLPGELHPMPFIWLIAEGRWVPRESVFIAPPTDRAPDFGPWNNNCIKCHATHGKPRPMLDDPENAHIETQVAELGIACEACHGPGEEHVRANSNPLRRYGHYTGDAADETVVQPERLSVRAGTQVCGFCHSVSNFNKKESFWMDGSDYRPGGELAGTKTVSHPRSSVGHAEDQLGPLRNSFWPDGVVRLLGREYNSLLDTPCHQRGEMTCLSCHTLHGDDPVDQLQPGMRGDRACLQCHESYADRIAQHTHHPVGSAGAQCLNCHMTYTVYGLLKSTRSHTIESPDATVSKRVGRPNACNQCHIDRTLAWAAERLSTWYGQPPVDELDEDEKRVSATLLWLLRGDAAQRALAAWTLGWEEARAVAGTDWQAPFLARLLDDPYDAVRFVVGESLGRMPGYEAFDYDFVADPESRAAARSDAIAVWKQTHGGRMRRSPAFLLDEEGRLLESEIDRLQGQRDDTPITLSE